MGAILAHSLCNYLGVPPFSRVQGPRGTGALVVAGIGVFAATWKPLLG